MTSYIIEFDQLNINDVEQVGGKNASLGEMIGHLSNLGVSVPNGFATTADAPMPIPIARLITVNVTGKVKLIAVRASVPRKLMNHVSTKLKVKSMIMPTIMGKVIRISDCFMDPSTRL